MKRVIVIFILAITIADLYGQVIEGKSGVTQFNISRKGTQQKKPAEESRAPADTKPPVITLQSPLFGPDSVTKSATKTLTVKGKVEDAGGIYEVVVNGVDAQVSADGIFLAEIPLAYGKNTVRIVARDLSYNSSAFQFYSDRSTAVIAAAPVKPANTWSISFISPKTSGSLFASDKLTLNACVKSAQPIRKLVIYRNNSFVNGYLSNQIISRGDCSFEINEPVTLKLGVNELTVEAYTEFDTLKNSIIVEYSFYAARNFAILIGNEKYDDPKINELSEPVKDVTELYNVLINKYNFDPDNVMVLKNKTKADIIGTLHQLRSKVTSSDNLLIFYAGHGYWDADMGVGYWLPKDARKDNPVNWIPNTDLTNYLGAIKTKHTLLIADACFSGAIFKTRSAFSDTYAVEMLYQLTSRKAITSGYMSEVPDRSVFFQYFIKNLKENDKDFLPAEELFSKMRMAVISNTENVPQFGTIQNVGDEGGDFIFIKRKPGSSK
jgi:hypothetical protein